MDVAISPLCVSRSNPTSNKAFCRATFVSAEPTCFIRRHGFGWCSKEKPSSLFKVFALANQLEKFLKKRASDNQRMEMKSRESGLGQTKGTMKTSRHSSLSYFTRLQEMTITPFAAPPINTPPK